jgi:hypothetical protein
MTNPSYTQGEPGQLRSATDAIPQATDGTGESPRLAIGDKVRHRISGQTGEVVDLHADPFVKEVTHGVVNWTGDGDGYGQGYSDTNLVKF